MLRSFSLGVSLTRMPPWLSMSPACSSKVTPRSAPSFWPHEVLNALLVGEKRKRISKELARSFLDDLAALPIVLEQFPAGIVFDRIQQLSREHGLTAYDAAYLDLALDSGLPLATLDEDLVRACKKAQCGWCRK